MADIEEPLQPQEQVATEEPTQQDPPKEQQTDDKKEEQQPMEANEEEGGKESRGAFKFCCTIYIRALMSLYSNLVDCCPSNNTESIYNGTVII